MRTFVTLATLAAFAAAGNQARSGEAALDLGSLDVTKGEEIDTNITEATVFLDNADSMEAKAEFDWDTYELQGFTFTKLLQTINNDDHKTELAGQVRAGFMQHYESATAGLPEVCESGKQCRQDVKTDLKMKVGTMWSDAMQQIQTKLTNAMIISEQKIKNSYTDAFQCDHGCECQFIQEQYDELNLQIANKVSEIAMHQVEIDIQIGLIAGYEVDPCDFTSIADEFGEEWDTMATHAAEEIAALADWKNDGYEMENVVDQTAFNARYGFEYESSRFDEYL